MHLKSFLWLVLGFVTAFPLSGQESAKKAEKAAATLKSMEERVDLGLKRMGIVVDRLNQLEAEAAKDPRKAYEKFKENRIEFEEIRASIRKDAVLFRTQSEAHYKTWESELAARPDSAIKQLSDERLQKARERYAQLAQKMEAARTPVTETSALWSDLDLYFSTELSRGSIEAAKPILNQARDSAKLAEKAVLDIKAEFASLRKEFAVGR